MDTPTVNERIFVLLFQCGKCGRPIALTHCMAGATLAEVKDRIFKVSCALHEDCGWNATLVGNEANEVWQVPWSRPYQGG
jgi:hypothetical protein